MKIAVIGQGYVGLPLAKAAANAGHTVIGFDNNETVIKQLLSSELTTANYTPTLDPKTITGCDIYIIAVPTPLDSNNKPDLSYLKSAAKQVGEVAKDGALIINESTSYPGTLREVVEATISSINKSKLLYAAAPERIDPANTKWSIKNTPRVIAGLSDEATTATLNFYKSFCDQVVAVSCAEVAEAAKLFENTFRQVNIALVNEFAQIAEKFGISANEVIDALRSPDISSITLVGIPYLSELKEALTFGQWQEGDRLTNKIILELAAKDKIAKLTAADISQIPCDVWMAINQEWMQASNNRFGWTVQKQVWKDLGGKLIYTEDTYWQFADVYEKFSDRVGWRKPRWLKLGISPKIWRKYENLIFAINAPRGHLPSLLFWEGFNLVDAVFYRLEICDAQV